MNSASVDVDQNSFDNNSSTVQDDEKVSQLQAVSDEMTMNNDILQPSEFLHDCHSR